MQIGTEVTLAVVVIDLAAFQKKVTNAEIKYIYALRALVFLCLRRRRQVRAPVPVGEDAHNGAFDANIADIPGFVEQRRDRQSNMQCISL